MAVLSSSQATPVCTCPARRPRWCPLDSPWRLKDCAFRKLQIVGFPQLLPGYPIGPQLYNFRGSVTRPIHSLHLASYTPLQDMHAGSLQIRWLTFSGENWAVSYPYSLGNIIQFHELLSDPMDLNLTRHEEQNCRVGFTPTEKRRLNTAHARTCRSRKQKTAALKPKAAAEVASEKLRYYFLHPTGLIESVPVSCTLSNV